ncbi:MAG: hypothetical protein CME70_23425 [Halobacteriovorax sp.]|nr:hypothetical protein [Halobacteriovorax sp.]|tara:strand:- start:129909 stop:130178 length:270 start_codon:yes stop_codon:yes gene_type:complete
MKSILLTLTLLVSFNLFASGASDTAEAVTETIRLFEESHDEDTIADFKGVKASPNDHGVSVTVYLNSGSKMKFGCHRHSANEPFECHHN